MTILWTTAAPSGSAMPAEQSHLSDEQFPAFFLASDAASGKAQRAALRGNRIRLIGAIAAAIGGAFSLSVGRVDVWALVSLIGFIAAFAAELYMALQHPERDWYQARAGAESAKTLSWRYAVCADPFFAELPEQEADNLFRARISQVARQVSQAVALPSGDGSSPTPPMRVIRKSSIGVRREVYLEDRTRAQRDWYTRKAAANKQASAYWRGTLLTAELVAVALAAIRLSGGWDIDLAGVLAAGIGAGAAWLALKQHTTLRSAYALTAAELEKQIATLTAVEDADWPESVADAEEAISREHTMWLASRSEINETIG